MTSSDMTPKTDFDRTLSAWLDARAQPHAPEHLIGEALERTVRTRPRPAWRIPERWIPMTVALRPAAIPRGLLLALVTVGLLIALAAATLYVGGRPSLFPAVLPATGPAANGLIAFDNLGDIYTVEPDGSDRQLLVEGSGVVGSPSWSPDGTRLAYWSAASDGEPEQLMVVDADGSDPVTVASEVVGRSGYGIPAWSPDGLSLAFSTRTVNGLGSCVGSSDVAPSFCSSRIFVAAADGSTGAVQVGDPDLAARTAAWSPDGSTIAFSGGDSEKGIGLYLMDPDGTDVRRLDQVSGTGWGFFRLDWSPDGESIVATAGKESWDIWVFAADGSGETRVSDDPEVTMDQFFPAYAPDGTLAWSGGAALPYALVLLEEGGVPVTLAGFDGTPVWSPDGLLIATTTPTAFGDLIVVDREGAIVTTIENVGSTPSWQRLAP